MMLRDWLEYKYAIKTEILSLSYCQCPRYYYVHGEKQEKTGFRKVINLVSMKI